MTLRFRPIVTIISSLFVKQEVLYNEQTPECRSCTKNTYMDGSYTKVGTIVLRVKS